MKHPTRKDKKTKIKLKRYWLFSGRDYECLGGMADFYDRYNILGIAQTAWDTDSYFQGHDWAHILDSHSGDIVAQGRRGKGQTKWLVKNIETDQLIYEWEEEGGAE